MQAENDAKDGADFSAAKHCRMELILQQWYIFLYFWLFPSIPYNL